MLEVNRPNRAARRLKGKSDPLDAYQAAKSVLEGRTKAIPKAKDGPVECLRILRSGRASAIKARTAAINQIKALLVSAPDKVRAKYRALANPALITALQRTRPSGHMADPEYVTLLTLKALAARCQALGSEIEAADAALKEILDSYAPMLCDLPGVGTEVASQLLITVGDNPERLGNEAQFASLVGVAPVPASSGKTTRHRLSRGGDRNANNALHQVVLVRMGSCQRTKDYVAKRMADGKSKRETMRCLSNRCWLVWCLLAGWLPALLDVTPAASGPSGSERWCLSFDSSVRRGWRRPVLFRWLDRRSSRMPPVTH